MERIKAIELPRKLQNDLNTVTKLEWITIVYLLTVVAAIGLVLGNSQAMKTAWIEDILTLIPAISFLIAKRIYTKRPNKDYPYGYHRVFSIAFLVGSVALLAVGLLLFIDSMLALIKQEHPTIGMINIFGFHIWLGWLMIAALLYSVIPTFFLGRLKISYAKRLNNKILYIDAEAQKADYMTGGAAILGILGIGFGLWWADAVAALFISFEILRDGLSRTKSAVTDLMDKVPQKVDENKPSPLVEEIKKDIQATSWIRNAAVRIRESGQVYFVEVLVDPRQEDGVIANIAKTKKRMMKKYWQIQDITMTPVTWK